jgi:hypothetical protein
LLGQVDCVPLRSERTAEALDDLAEHGVQLGRGLLPFDDGGDKVDKGLFGQLCFGAMCRIKGLQSIHKAHARCRMCAGESL